MSKPDLDILSRALGYPYDIRDSSFTLRRGVAEAFEAGDVGGRHPVLAVGSNRAPQQLTRKFGTRPGHAIPVQAARLANHDVVYSAHLTIYGAVPATLRHVPGTTVHVAVTWLTDAQLSHMHTTELPNGNYDYVRLAGIQLETEHGETLTSAYVYQSRRGHLRAVTGEPLALAEVAATARRLDASTQRQALEHVRATLAPAQDLGSFVHDTVTNHGERRRHIATLESRSVASAYWPSAEIMVSGRQNN